MAAIVANIPDREEAIPDRFPRDPLGTDRPNMSLEVTEQNARAVANNARAMMMV